VKAAPEKAVEMANEWRLKGGGLPARQCLGLAYSKLERWEPAATAFEQAALEAETAKDARRADFWVQAGNSWLASGDPVKARKAFDAALAVPTLTAELRGEAHLDRARARWRPAISSPRGPTSTRD
jgi:tetratricopeptide (TPR) repeat protein